MADKIKIDIDQIVERLTSISSVSELISLAHTNAILAGFNRIRFYVYIPNELRFVSRESHGHDADWAEKFRSGNIVRRLSDFPLAKRESFWCLHERAPVAVVLGNSRKPGDLRLEERFNVKCLPMILEDYKHDPLPFDYRKTCIHFPLEAGKRYVGKLCCDTTDPIISPEMGRRVNEFWHVCKLIAPSLEMLLSRERNPEPLELGPQNLLPIPDQMQPTQESVQWFTNVRAKVLKDMIRMTNADELLDYCTYDLPRRFFGCKFASFFTLSEDSFGSRLLVLRRTSYTSLKESEDYECYDLDHEDGLTAWVARHRLPLRFTNLKEMEARKAMITENRRNKDFPIWADKITDSEQHNGFLAVPVLSETEELLGVLRLTQKEDPNQIFSEDDQVLLVRIAREHIAPAIKRLFQAQRFNFILDRLPKMVSLAVQDSVTPRRLAAALTLVLEECFPKGKGHKRFLVNKLDREGDSFYVDHLGGDLPFDAYDDKKINLKGTLTEMALRPNQREAVYVQDFNKAGIADSVLTRAPTAKCALECKISFEQRNYGVLVALSDRYDLTTRHARLLELICLIAGGIRARREMLSFELTQMGLGHDFQSQLHFNQITLEKLLTSSTTDPSVIAQLEGVAKANRFAMSLLRTYLSPSSVDTSIIEANAALPISIVALAEEVICAAEAAVGKRGMIDIQVETYLHARIWQEPVSAILLNLVKNALGACSTDNGAVEIRARIKKKKKNDWLEITIANNGFGLSKDLKRSLSFDPMSLFMGDVRDYTFGRKGYGLYLASRRAMCYRLADGSCGEITHKTRPRNKCPNEFTVAIPILANS